MIKKTRLRTRLLVFVSSLCISVLSFLAITALADDDMKNSFSDDRSGDSIVIDNIDIEYLYDKEKYEVVELSPEAYVVVRGNKTLLNALKYSKEPRFYIDLVGKKTGSYREELQWEGIHEDLRVDVYPTLIDLRIMEQQTVRLTPIIEYMNDDKLAKDKVIQLPELEKKEVLIKGTQEQLANVSAVKGYIDVTGYSKTRTVAVTLKAYDRNNKVIEDINLLDKVIGVTVPVEGKDVQVKEVVVEVDKKETKEVVKEPIKETVIVETIKEVVVKEESGTATKPPSSSNDTKTDKEDTKPEVTKEGTLSIINKPKDLELVIHTPKLVFSTDVKLDLSGYKTGFYEITYDDNGVKKVFKFDLLEKEIVSDSEDTNINQKED